MVIVLAYVDTDLLSEYVPIDFNVMYIPCDLHQRTCTEPTSLSFVVLHFNRNSLEKKVVVLVVQSFMQLNT